MYLWRKAAEPHWLKAREEVLQGRFGGSLSTVSTPGRKRVQIEIACTSRNEARKLVQELGGRAQKLRPDWLKRFARKRKPKPLRIGKRLVVVRSPKKREADSSPYRLIVPAGAAFGTGEHATTAMSLRLLEQLTREWKNGWSLADLGTGSGILALAARRFGARRVLAIDADPLAISTAKTNARRNGISGVDFQLGDLRHWKPPRNVDIITANLFSELLIALLPKLKRSGWLILSGVLRAQKQEFLRALRRNEFEVVKLCQRGKWIAILARRF
jgi:ribosomal protein L11 methyltransferase